MTVLLFSTVNRSKTAKYYVGYLLDQKTIFWVTLYNHRLPLILICKYYKFPRPKPKSSTNIPPAKRQKVSDGGKKLKATVQETPDEEEPEVWFDDVDPCLIDVEPKRKSESAVKESDNKSATGRK